MAELIQGSKPFHIYIKGGIEEVRSAEETNEKLVAGDEIFRISEAFPETSGRDLTKETSIDSELTEQYTPDDYGKIEELVSYDKMLKEMEKKMKKKLDLLIYYSFIRSFSIFFFGIFVMLGVLRTIGPFSAITGAIITLLGIIGSFVDYKKRATGE